VESILRVSAATGMQPESMEDLLEWAQCPLRRRVNLRHAQGVKQLTVNNKFVII
jgi:hypothetical protein